MTAPTTVTEELSANTLVCILRHTDPRVALIGLTLQALDVRAVLTGRGLGSTVLGIFDPDEPQGRAGLATGWADLAGLRPNIIVICADADKEDLLRATDKALGDRASLPEVVLAGTAHLEFRDPVYDRLDAPALVPSYATGYPHTRVHLYQCLQAAAVNGLHGAIVEFGSFKGGTTAWLARTARHLGLAGPVIGFDSWAGFPPRRSLLDLYEHPRCVFDDLDGVRSHLERLEVELVVGDIADTAATRLENEPILLAFVDTDNYSPARAALTAVLPNLVRGGAVVFDHFHTTDDYIMTIGERMAAQDILTGAGLLQIFGSGVFVRIA